MRAIFGFRSSIELRTIAPPLPPIAAVMRIQIASDLHLEMHPGRQPEIHDFCGVDNRDVLVLAGDIGSYLNA